MAERAGGWIERVERRGWLEFMSVGSGSAAVRALGPFGAGFKVVDGIWGGHEGSVVQAQCTIVVSGSPSLSGQNLRGGVPLFHSDLYRAPQWVSPVVSSERVGYYPMGLRFWPYLGSDTGAWYVIWAVYVATQTPTRWTLALKVERRWHEWRWAPEYVGGGEGGE